MTERKKMSSKRVLISNKSVSSKDIAKDIAILTVMLFQASPEQGHRQETVQGGGGGGCKAGAASAGRRGSDPGDR